ncbi:MAG TPA: hypothetical protein DD381_09875 [Lentisphaeria bacterium]|nr:hypothetical protein [Lentisphaeria bacterium]
MLPNRFLCPSISFQILLFSQFLLFYPMVFHGFSIHRLEILKLSVFRSFRCYSYYSDKFPFSIPAAFAEGALRLYHTVISYGLHDILKFSKNFVL